MLLSFTHSYRYYPALKTLEQLEHIYLPTISHYRFSEHMKKNLSKVHESIKESSMMELKDFLENIRKFSPKIGKVAMRHVIYNNFWNHMNRILPFILYYRQQNNSILIYLPTNQLSNVSYLLQFRVRFFFQSNQLTVYFNLLISLKENLTVKLSLSVCIVLKMILVLKI